MNRGGFKVEQIKNGLITIDYDVFYSPSELKGVIAEYFPVEDIKTLSGNYKGHRFRIYAKNITYLGNPWEGFKKRIQLGSNFKETVANNKAQRIETILLGVYHYEDTLIFAEFDAESYAFGKSNNSAAHIHSFDLQRAVKDGIFTKTDKGNHRIMAFMPNKIADFLEIKFGNAKDPLENLKAVFGTFYSSVPKEWVGIDCYQQMLEANWEDRRQTEWAGFYHEYRLSKFLDENPEFKHTVIFQKNKTKDSIDLDLYYPEMKTYGDLKAHTVGDTIIGNSYETLEKAIKIGPLYYVICEHTTIKDIEFQYRTLLYWHNFIREEKLRSHDPMSQKNRMKGQVNLVDFLIVQIDQFNMDRLSSFQKGFMNSDGNPRKEKFTINKKDIDNFLVYKHVF